jgi:hypothetical protein
MPGHTSAHGSKSKSHGDKSNKGSDRGHSRFSSGSGYYGGTTKTKTTTNNNNNRETYRTTPRTIDPAVKRRNELALKVAKQKKDAEAFKNYEYQKPTGIAKFNLLAQALDITGLGKKTHEVNKSYYERNVIGKAKPGGGFYGASVEDYKGYISGRGSGDVDAMGRTITTNNNGGGRVVIEKNVGGSTILTETKTEAEKTADAKADEEYDARKTKRRGRRQTILTSQSGASGNFVLGKKTLLGV